MKRALLISIDGLGWDLLNHPSAQIPHLRKLAAQGVRGSATTVLPSATWPAHASLVSGCYPLRHGVVANAFYSRKLRALRAAWQIDRPQLIKVPTLFDLVAAQKGHSAAVFWPGSQGDPSVHWNLPLVYGRRELARAASKGLLRELIRGGIPAQWFDAFARKAMFLRDAASRSTARYLITRHSPEFVAVHFESVDLYGHSYGPASRPTFWALETIDRYVGELLDSYRQRRLLDALTVFVVSDHGMLPVTRRVDANRLLHKAGLLSDLDRPLSGPLLPVAAGQLLYLYALAPDKASAQLKAAAALFQRRPEVEQILSARALGLHHLPTASANLRMADLVVVGRPHVIFERNASQQISDPVSLGGHGYLPAHKGLACGWVAAGPGIRATRDPLSCRIVDLAPTLARLLGLSFSGRIDGKAIL